MTLCCWVVKITVMYSEHDLYTDQYNKNQTGWLITLYKMGPGQVMLLYTSSLYFTLICFTQVQSKLYSYLSDAPHILHVHIITIWCLVRLPVY
jgi:hypothetical protein